MRQNKTISAAVRFALFTQEWSIHPATLGEMVALANAAKVNEERAISSPDERAGERADKARRELESKAALHGCRVIWPGLWPVLEKAGRQADLPSL